MSEETEFAGMVAVIAGGASGIGQAAAYELLRRGAVVAVLDRQPGPGDDGVDHLTCDVSCTDQVDAAITEVVMRHGRLDVLVNCAGVEARGGLDEVTDEDCERVLDVNVVGMLRTMRAALPHLKESSSAAIVNTSSVAADVGMSGLALYSASKGAVLAMTRAVAADLLPHGVRVNCVSPGTVDTPWIQRLLEASEDREGLLEILKARQPMRRLVAPDEVARAIAYLASPRCPSVTGTSLSVDGGVVGLTTAPDVSAST
jgi:NAD(P)-dependent dehydrogenase (short-subunit alcohol dehydrogenase family)